MNKALRASKGKYIARMDADDVSHPQRLEMQIRFLETNPEIGLLGTFYRELESDSTVLGPTVRFPVNPIIIKWCLCFENPIPHPPIVIRKDLIDRVGGYEEQWSTSQDYDLFIRLSKITRLANYPEVLFFWRTHDRSITSTRNQEQRKNAVLISQRFISEILNESIPVEDVKLLWDKKQDSFFAVLRRSIILYRLCLVIIGEHLWTSLEKKLLREYVAKKIFYYLRPYLKKAATWRFLIRVLFLSPTTFVKMTNNKVKTTLSIDS